MLKDVVSVPGLTLRYLFKTIPKSNFFSLFRETNKDLDAAAKTSCRWPCHFFFIVVTKKGSPRFEKIAVNSYRVSWAMTHTVSTCGL